MKAFLFLATGFEEIEATTPMDVLRRAGIDLQIISTTGKREVVGAHNISIVSDALFEDVDLTTADVLILPGGMPGAANLNKHNALKDLNVDYNNKGKYIAAICAAPLVFGGLGLLQGKNAICYPGFESQLTGAIISKQTVVQDGNIITGKGPAYAMQFSLQLVATLCGEEKEAGLRNDLLVD